MSQARLIIRRSNDALHASWIDSSGQESNPFPLALPLAADDLKELRWYLEDYMNFTGYGDRPKGQRVEAQLQVWGRDLFKALFDGFDGVNVYRDLMDAVRRDGRGLLTLGTTDPDVLGQPWELLRDSKGPLTFQGVTIRRQLVGFTPVAERRLSPPLRVLLIVSRPKDTGFIDPRNSIPPVLDALEELPAGMVEVAFCEPPTLPRLEEMISEANDHGRPFHIVHFDGHGTYLPRTGIGALAFENDQEKTELVTGSRLGDLLAKQGVPLAILEACRGADLSDRPVFGSLAPALLHSGVGSVIAFSHSVHVQAAKLFVERFYQKLARGKTVGQALEEARTKLHADRARWLHQGPNPPTINLEDWFIPQLYQVGDDLALFAPGDGVATATRRRRTVSLPGFPPEPMYKFHGRAKELLELERAFRKHAAVVIHGMGGMGKTALSREAAHWWVRTGKFESAVFFSFEQRHGADSVVKELGKALAGEAFSALPAEEQWRRAVELFGERRVLLVWDNFESTLEKFQQEEVLPFDAAARSEVRRLFGELTSGKPEGRLLVTCRPDDTGLPGVKKVELHGLARPDSLHLLVAIVDREGIDLERPGYERPEVDALLGMLDDHPLSISLVAPHFKALPPKQVREEFGPLLARFANPGAAEDRNKSLWASLEFSKKRLSPETRGVLPYLAWFQGGVFENVFLGFAELSPEVWAPVRAELLATALLSVEEGFSTPYLRFHPTLPYAARAEEVPDPEAAQQRFLGVYQAVRQMVDKGLRGQHPATGMAVLAREEANARSALALAFRCGDRHHGYQLADTLAVYLERSGRRRERSALVQWVRELLPQDGGLDEATCAALLDHAWSRLEQGAAAEAVRIIQGLLQRLQTEGLPDPRTTTFQTAVCQMYLGRIYHDAGRPDLALEPLGQAVASFEPLGKAGRGNLAAALGDLANALRLLGRFDEALAAAEHAVAISREQGNQREIAGGLGRSGAILDEQQRCAEAEARYEEALHAAQKAGDVSLQGSLLQYQGILHCRQGHHDRAVELYQQALALFQRANNSGSEMRTCDLLGTAEKGRGQLDAAEAWYGRSRELAGPPRNDRPHLAVVAQNLGVLYQSRAEQVGETSLAFADLLHRAVASVQESLEITLEMNNQVGAAASYRQLGVLYMKLQEWEQAEAHLRHALQIDEALNHPDVRMDYGNLAKVARGRGDAEAADRWQAKCDAKRAEVRRLQRGKGSGVTPARLSEQVAQALLELARACYAARTSGAPLPPEAAELLAQLREAPAPFPAVASFLDAVAAKQPLPPLPADLPPPLPDILNALSEAVQA